MLCVVGDRIVSVFLSSLAHSVDRTVGSICTAVAKVVDLSALEHLTGLDVCEDCTAITLDLLRLVPRRKGEKYMNPRVHKNGQLVYLVLKCNLTPSTLAIILIDPVPLFLNLPLTCMLLTVQGPPLREMSL